jgi:SAM-dependent methyltransferase
MTRFGRWQSMQGGLSKWGLVGRVYGFLVGYTQVGGFARSLMFKRLLARHQIGYSKVLDAGCGAGDYALYLAERDRDATVIATDCSGKRIESLSAVASLAGLTNLIAVVKEHSAIEEVNTYDLVLSISSLEYTEKKAEVLANFYNALVPGGYLYLQYPLFKQTRIFPAKYFTDYEKEERWRLDGGVSQHYDRSCLERDLRTAGFIINCIYFTTGFWGRLAFELSHILSNMNRVCYAISIPMLKLCAYLDMIILDKKSGDGIVALCRKPL